MNNQIDFKFNIIDGITGIVKEGTTQFVNASDATKKLTQYINTYFWMMNHNFFPAKKTHSVHL